MHDRVDDEFQSIIGDRKPDNSLKKTIKILMNDDQLAGAFCFNKFTNETEHFHDNIILSHQAKKGSSLSDIDISCIRSYLSQKYNFSPSKINLEDALIKVSMERSYHPIKDYLEGLKWDGIKRLDSWLITICGAEDNEYSRAVGRKLIVAAIKRIYEPGCYYAQLVILEGRQRIYKSRLVKEMGQGWYASIHLKTNDTKTIVEEMRGKWILEIEELAGFGKQDIEHMKAFISRQVDRVRISYGRRADDYPRQSIMIATMNPEDGENRYLNDTTGNVRYWPIKCGDNNIDVDTFIDIREQMFAEAMVLYQGGESMWLEGDAENSQALIEQEQRLSEDPWVEMIRKWIDDNLLKTEFTTTQIAIEGIGIPKERVHSGASRRISRILHKLGYERERKREGWVYSKSAEKLGVEWNE